MTALVRLGDRRIHALMTSRRKIVWLDLADSPTEIERRELLSWSAAGTGHRGRSKSPADRPPQ